MSVVYTIVERFRIIGLLMEEIWLLEGQKTTFLAETTVYCSETAYASLIQFLG